MRASPFVTLAITVAIQSLVSAAVLVVPVLAPVIGPVYGVGAETLGAYVALVYCGAMIGSLMAGEWVTRLGAIRASQLGMVLSASGLLLSLLGWLPLVVAGALLIGIGYGPITPASSHLLVKTTPARRMSLVFSIKQTGVPLGGVLAGVVAPWLLEWVGWRGALAGFALASLLCTVLSQGLRRELDADRKPLHRAASGKLRAPLKLIFSQRSLVLLALASLTFSAVQLSVSAYTVTYLHDSLGYTLVLAGLMLSIAQVAGVVGRILWGWCADRLGSAISTLAVLAIAMALSCWALAALPAGSHQVLLGLVLFALGAGAIGWNGVYLAEVARQAPPGQAGMATAGTLTCTFLGVVLGPPVFGLVVSLTGSYRIAFFLIAVPALLAGVLLYAQRRHFRLPGQAAGR
ncbi:MFS transporter [Orrella sp. JC864]|uniref:MFS transporter n=1 Tax=Orrella sp. JC864 TaxID=3120298 RepID=UPI0030090561